MRLEVRKDDLAQVRLVEAAPAPLADGEVRLRVARFAITANNVTYGVVGERIGYWRFFPADSGWGVIPVWGVGAVAESRHPAVAVGERLYGYWPMGREAVLAPAKVSESRLLDGSSHRADLPAVYNSYVRLGAENAAEEEARAALWPLYATSFCLADWLDDHADFGAAQIVVPSASSKTAIGLGCALAEREGGPRRIALTSPANRAFVERLGLWDEVRTYDDIEALPAEPTVIVDMSGSGALIGRLHRRLGEAMRHTAMVGVTHYDEAGMGPDFLRDRSAMFFAPAHIAKRAKDWGPGEFERRSGAFVGRATERSRAWLEWRRAEGPAAVAAAWAEVLAGRTPPSAVWIAAL